MKKLVLSSAAALFAFNSFAQTSIDPEVGLNFGNIRTKVGDNDAATSDAKLGLSAGAGIRFTLPNNLYLKPGIYYHMLGGQETTLLGDAKTTMHTLRVPVNLGYQFPISSNAGAVFAEVGPYVGYALSGKNVTETIAGDVKTDINYGSELAEVKPLDFGVNFNLGYETPWGVYVKGSYGMGLTTISNVDKVKSTLNNWNIGIGYRIAL
jgi:hypothetical protein